MPQHIIFEGAELTGKSWLMSEIYNYLEPKYNHSKTVLDGCHWFNCDIGIFGTPNGKPIIDNYLKIFKTLKNKNIIVEKLHLADLIYNRLHNKKEINYKQIEKALKDLNFKIILCTFPEDKKLISKRIKDRLNLYPHYSRILQTPDWYINQQREYLKEIKNTKLPYFIIEAKTLPDKTLSEKILKWLGEK